MEYGEFNSINTSLVEYERTTKRVPTMKSEGGSDSDSVSETAGDNNGFFTPNEKIDFSKVDIEPLLLMRLISRHFQDQTSER